MIKTFDENSFIEGRCYKCINYIPLIKPLWGYEKVMTARGKCNLTGTYKQRTDKKCKRAEYPLIDEMEE